tara:strand:- start:105 stop:1112 length:1008 start_codon:yes stop_codon:yes gene_type:complete
MEMVNNGNEKYPKKPLIFSCENCDFTCSNKKDYKRHLSTGKHEMIINGNENTPKNPKANKCVCGKTYKHISGLSRHKQKCSYQEIKNEVIDLENEVIEVDPDNEVIDLDNETKVTEIDHPVDKDELIMKLLQQNSEVMELLKEQSKTAQEQSKLMQEMIPKIGNNNTTNNTNTNNNNFNLNVFLNETCKDAMNIKDFINSLRVQCNEMKEIEKIGFIEVASKVLLKELSGMDVSKRPIHCSDLKRETLYIKDNDVWEKESESKPKMLHMINQMQKESYTTLDAWISKNPGCQRYDHPQHTLFMNTWGDICTLDPVKDVNKISKRIAREVLIDKST